MHQSMLIETEWVSETVSYPSDIAESRNAFAIDFVLYPDIGTFVLLELYTSILVEKMM